MTESRSDLTGLPNGHLPPEDRNPAQHHESRAATKDRAYHVAREHGMSRSTARDVAEQATENARRSRGV